MYRTCMEEVKVLILRALSELYDRLLEDPSSGVARYGYSDETVSVALELSREGDLVRAVPLGAQKGKRVAGIRLQVPESLKRSGTNPPPNFLCDKVEYVLGVREGSGKADDRATRRHSSFKAHHETVLAGCTDDGAWAVLSFLSSWRPDRYLENDRIGETARSVLDGGGRIVFRLEGDTRFIHERPAVMLAWERYRATLTEGKEVAQCLLTGEIGPIARLHKSISGVVGAESSGASLVSFNFQATESYGKRQGANSPVSERATFGYGTALNWLTASDRHRVMVGDTTTLFWAERSGPEEDLLLDLFAETLGSESRESDESPAARSGPKDGPVRDEVTASRLRDVLQRVVRGKDIPEDLSLFDQGVRFFILGLAPNAARLAVRFWNVDTFGSLLENIRKHFEDMAVVHRETERSVSVDRLLIEAAPPTTRKRDSVPKTVIASLMRSIMDGAPYPPSLYATILSRIRVDSDDPAQSRAELKVTYPRAAFIKAYLSRKARVAGDKSLEEVLTEMLNTENRNPGYLLGRLFAVLEKAQRDANPKIKSTIKDRYYASASATPRAVFPVLIRLAQHHLAKAEYGRYLDDQIQDVVAHIDVFPAYLDLDQQGLFALGYYQQKSAFYPKGQEKTGEVESV